MARKPNFKGEKTSIYIKQYKGELVKSTKNFCITIFDIVTSKAVEIQFKSKKNLSKL